MYKILVVDDESLERRGLRKIISDEFSNVLIDEAENGRTAIMKAEQFRPDVVFMDIKMPGIDGIEAAKEIKNMNQAVQIIMVTAFDTFEYARQLMKIGVKDYILKPSSKEEIISPLKKVLNEIEAEREKRKEELYLKDNYQRALSFVQSRVITSLLVEATDPQNLSELELEHTFQKPSFVMVFEFKVKSSEKEHKKDYITFIQSEVSLCFRNNFSGEESLGRFPILIQLTEKEMNKVKERAISCGKELINKSRKYYPNFEISIGIGRVYDEIDKFVHSYHEALFTLSALKHPFMCQYYKHYDKVNEENEVAVYPYQLEKKLVETITAGLVENVPIDFKNYIDAIVSYCEKQNEYVEEKIAEFFILLNRQIVDSGISISIQPRFFEKRSYLQLQEELSSIAFHIHSMYYSRNKDIVVIAKDYIIEHFESPLTLEEVSEVVELSPQYFSKIFKERAGLSFIDYLTELRVEKAKDLMRNEKKSVKEVCFEVGYKDPNYFSRVFKKYTGVSPSDYR